MTVLAGKLPEKAVLPDHMQLPFKDESMVSNFQEHPQTRLLDSSLEPLLAQRYSDGNYLIGADSFIYWRLTEPPQEGARAPDWFLVLGVPPLYQGEVRRSYVLWQEKVRPLLAIEYVSGDGSAERDPTPELGKFWVYEQGIAVAYYAIYEVNKASVDVFRLVSGRFQKMSANARGHYPIDSLGVELGIWPGKYLRYDLPWLRWWDAQGNILLNDEERADQERDRADQERDRADQERDRADKLAAKLRELGINPEG